MLIGEKLELFGININEKLLFLKLEKCILVKCAETKYKIIQGINNNNLLIYNNKSLTFNLSDFSCDLRSGFIHFNNFALAYIIHDVLYSKINTTFTRKESDEILLILLKSLGRNKLLAKLEYLAVRIFGRGHFDNT